MRAARATIGWRCFVGWLLATSTLSACGDTAKDDPADATGSGGQVAAATGSGGGGAPVGPHAMGSAAAGSGANAAHDPAAPSTNGGSGGSHASADDAAVRPVVVDAGPEMNDDTQVPGTPTLFWLEITGNTVWTANADGSDERALTSGKDIAAPDGVAVDLDAEGGHVYWTNMGNALGGGNSGSLQRAKLDGSAVETIVKVGSINTPKQMTIDHVNKKLYFCDREGAKVWRANLDGSELEILVSGHDFIQLVGIALDVENEQFYFTDRMAKKIHRAGFAFPSGETAATRTDIEELFVASGDAMPIDLDLDLDKRQMYWTDRVEGTLHRASMDLASGQTSSNRKDVETLITDAPDAIGISLDLPAGKLYFGQLNGQVTSANLDGSARTTVATSGSVSGVALVRIPAM